MTTSWPLLLFFTRKTITGKTMWCIVVDTCVKTCEVDSLPVILEILSKSSDEQFLSLPVTAVQIFTRTYGSFLTALRQRSN